MFFLGSWQIDIKYSLEESVFLEHIGSSLSMTPIDAWLNLKYKIASFLQKEQSFSISTQCVCIIRAINHHFIFL